MAVLVTGASGFLGTHVCQALRRAGKQVVTAGRSPASGDHVQLDLAEVSVSRVCALLADLTPDAVVNCAGATSGDVATLTAANISVPAVIVEAMLRTGSRCRLVHLGSAAEYGPGEVGVPTREDAPTRPTAAYGATKLAATEIIRCGRAAGLNATVLRVFNPVGARSPASTLAGRVAAELARASMDGDVARLGPLGAVRDFVDAGDVADAVLATVASTMDIPVLNIGSGRGVVARTLVRMLRDIAGFDGQVLEQEADSARSASVPWQQANVSAAHEVLGWRSNTDLESSLTELWKAAR